MSQPVPSTLADPTASQQALSQFPGIAPPRAISLATLPEHPCSYFPDRIARSRALWANRLPAELYRQFMDAGFRRSGKLIYQPICSRCRACQSIRVPVDRFAPDKSQRRCRTKNADITVSAAPPSPSEEAYALYLRYIRDWHGRAIEPQANEDSPEAFQRFLYDSPVPSLEFKYRDPSGALLAVGICDVSNQSLSSVYFYFDPRASRRSLGTFGALCELEYAREREIPFYYLGFWIEGCASMQYKNRFRPCELLRSDGNWVPQ